LELILLTGSNLVLAEILSEAKKYLDLLTFEKTSHSVLKVPHYKTVIKEVKLKVHWGHIVWVGPW